MEPFAYKYSWLGAVAKYSRCDPRCCKGVFLSVAALGGSCTTQFDIAPRGEKMNVTPASHVPANMGLVMVLG